MSGNETRLHRVLGVQQKWVSPFKDPGPALALQRLYNPSSSIPVKQCGGTVCNHVTYAWAGEG